MTPAPTLAHYAAARDRVREGGRARPTSWAGSGTLRVSIITVVRNSAATLAGTIHSVRWQEYRPIEYVIVDGGSTDGTLDVIAEHREEIDAWISEPDLGISDAFNKGVAIGSGDIIGIINADDWYEQDAVGEAVRIFEETGADIVYGKLAVWYGERREYLAGGDHRNLTRGMTLCHPALFAKRHLFEQHGLFRTDFRVAMDYEWLLRVLVAGARFSSTESVLANMRLGGASDRNWHRGLLEEVRAKENNLGGGLRAVRYHASALGSLLRTVARRLLERLGLGQLRWAYHAGSRKGRIRKTQG